MAEADFFGFYSPELDDFSGVGHSIEDCLCQARWGMKDHLALLQEQQLSIPPVTRDPIITIRNERNEAGLAPSSGDVPNPGEGFDHG
jgi:predicted RNase H-like HicB family nuclease